MMKKVTRTIKEMYEVYRKGGCLSDKELISLFDHFKTVSQFCGDLGDVFHLPFLEANRCCYELWGFIQARGLKISEV